MGGHHATVAVSTERTMATWGANGHDDATGSSSTTTTATATYPADIADEATATDTCLQKWGPPAHKADWESANLTASGGQPDVGVRDVLARKVFDPGGASGPSSISLKPTPESDLQPQGHSLHGQWGVHFYHRRYFELEEHATFHAGHTIF